MTSYRSMPALTTGAVMPARTLISATTSNVSMSVKPAVSRICSRAGRTRPVPGLNAGIYCFVVGACFNSEQRDYGSERGRRFRHLGAWRACSKLHSGGGSAALSPYRRISRKQFEKGHARCALSGDAVDDEHN